MEICVLRVPGPLPKPGIHHIHNTTGSISLTGEALKTVKKQGAGGGHLPDWKLRGSILPAHESTRKKIAGLLPGG